VALKQTPGATAAHFTQVKNLRERLAFLRAELWGDPVRQRFNEATNPSISGRVGGIAYGHWETRQAPTQTFQESLKIATREFSMFTPRLTTYFKDLEAFEATLEAAGAPYTPGRKF
jgi:hypothetical protein